MTWLGPAKKEMEPVSCTDGTVVRVMRPWGELNPHDPAGTQAEQIPAGRHAEQSVTHLGDYHRRRRPRVLLTMRDRRDDGHRD
jgi:hypothetical protein